MYFSIRRRVCERFDPTCLNSSPASLFHTLTNTLAPLPNLNLVEERRWRSDSSEESDGGEGGGGGGERCFVEKKKEESAVQISHPWPEWVLLMESLLKRRYFDFGAETNPFGHGEFKLGPKDSNFIRTACLNFGRDQFHLLRFLSRKDMGVTVEFGCPSLDRKVINSGKRLRAHLGIDEGNVCSSCNLRGDCDRAFVKAREDEGGRTVDVMRIILTYGLEPLIGSVDNKPCLNKKVKESVRSLLREIVEHSAEKENSYHPDTTEVVVKQIHPNLQDKDKIDAPMKQGNWLCLKCNFLNFARNIKCLRCDSLCEEKIEQLQEDNSDLPLKKGDWICSKCNFLNFAKSSRFLLCKEKPPKRHLNPGEWECDSCNYINFRRNMVFLKCDHRRPGASSFSLSSLVTKNQKVNTSEIPSCLVLKFLKHFCSSSSLRLEHCVGIDQCFNWDSFYASLIDNSTHKRHLNQVHGQLVVSGLQCDGFLMTKLVNGSSNIGENCYARKMFDEFPCPDVFMWNAIIRSYSRSNMFRESIVMYRWMRWEGVHPDCYTFPYVLKACTELSNIGLSRRVHGQVFRCGFSSDVFVQNGLVALYAKCGQIGNARLVFDRLYDRTIVSWTSIISGYAQNGEAMEALRMFHQMRNTDVKPDWIALISILRAYTDVDDLEQGRSLHGCVIKMGLEHEPDLLISLTALYAKCGQVAIARSFFDQMKTTNVIMWNAMISGYAKNGHAEEAVQLFRDMILRNIRPDSVSVRSTILACAQVGSLELAQWMDDYVSNSKYRGDIFVNTTLIDMYAKCGSVESARRVFDCMSYKDVVVWSAMIMGYGLHGRGWEAINLYHAMKQAGLCPNDVTFISLLTACNHSGLVKEGWELFRCMRGFGIEPRNEHYSCVVDLLGRAGYLGQAFAFVVNMPIEPGVSVWGALLSACKIHHHVTMGEYAANKLFSLDPYNTGHYVQLSNLYASSRMWDRVAHVRVLMREKGLTKDLGYSLIEINGKLQAFHVGDKSHQRAEEIFNELKRLEKRLKEVGFIPHTDSVLHDLNCEEKEENLCVHSERIAIAYGLISTAPGTTLRIIKNLRACVNCHSAIKLISKLVKREIIVRDANRFHHFKDGSCSCGDYW